MLVRVDHIGIAVRDLEKTIGSYSALFDGPPGHIEEVPSQKVKVAMYEAGESRVELLESTSPDSAIAKFLDKRGEGLHHVCFAVPDLDSALARLQQHGMEILPNVGGPGAEGSRVAFLHPRSAAGVLIELVERK